MVSNGFDIGYRKSSQSFSYSLTAFHIDTKDEIVRYELEGFEGMNFYKNLGLSKRYGIEVEGSHSLGKHHIVKASHTHKLNMNLRIKQQKESLQEFLNLIWSLNGHIIKMDSILS